MSDNPWKVALDKHNEQMAEIHSWDASRQQIFLLANILLELRYLGVGIDRLSDDIKELPG